MECSRCGSQNIKTFEMAHATYNVGIDASNRFRRMLLYGPLGLLIKPSQNSVARRTSPPEKPVPALALISVLFFVATLVWLIVTYGRRGFENAGTQTALVSNVLVFILTSLIVIWDVTRSLKARRKYPERFDDWVHSWICLQCGTTYKLPHPPGTPA